MNPTQDVKLSRIARGLSNPPKPELPRGLHRREAYQNLSASWNAVFEAWLNDDLDAIGKSLARMAFDVFDTAAVYGIDLGPHWKNEAESR